MSNYFDLVCVEHEEKMGFHWNWGNEHLAVLAKHLEGWAALVPLFDDPDWIGYELQLEHLAEDTPSVETIARFVAKHCSCTIRPRSEYGDWYVQARVILKP